MLVIASAAVASLSELLAKSIINSIGVFPPEIFPNSPPTKLPIPPAAAPTPNNANAPDIATIPPATLYKFNPSIFPNRSKPSVTPSTTSTIVSPIVLITVAIPSNILVIIAAAFFKPSTKTVLITSPTSMRTSLTASIYFITILPSTSASFIKSGTIASTKGAASFSAYPIPIRAAVIAASPIKVNGLARDASPPANTGKAKEIALMAAPIPFPTADIPSPAPLPSALNPLPTADIPALAPLATALIASPIPFAILTIPLDTFLPKAAKLSPDFSFLVSFEESCLPNISCNCLEALVLISSKETNCIFVGFNALSVALSSVSGTLSLFLLSSLSCFFNSRSSFFCCFFSFSVGNNFSLFSLIASNKAKGNDISERFSARFGSDRKADKIFNVFKNT